MPLAPQGGPVELHGDRIPAGMDAELEAAASRTALARLAPADPAAPVLADDWCGTETSVDDVAHDATGAGPAIKLVYARPSDQPNRFATFAEYLQDDAREIAESFGAAADGTRTVRFDTGTACGPLYVDAISIALPRTRDAYLAMTLDERFDALSDDLRARLTSVAGKRDFLVYADALPAGGVSGVATLYNDDRDTATNWNNSGGNVAFVFSFGSSRRTTAQHELGHNLGAVQDSAPHSTLAGHCFERYDVMCYADGGPRGTSADLVTSCATQSPPAWDCRADDYFDPDPAPGSYLDTHWNLYDSVYLCPPADCIVVERDEPATTTVAPPSGGGGGGSGGSTGTPQPDPASPTPEPEPTPPAPQPEPISPMPPAVIVNTPVPAPARSAPVAQRPQRRETRRQRCRREARHGGGRRATGERSPRAAKRRCRSTRRAR
ncbi:MAG TPA: hypothetical protein VFR97_05925 [Capillimicrobium sp.]|nr:hypothetical protein [Capillimicrobium sp.]